MVPRAIDEAPGLDWPAHPAAPAVCRARLRAGLATGVFGVALSVVFLMGLAPGTGWPMALVALALFLPNALWIVGGGVVSVLGLGGQDRASVMSRPAARPGGGGRCALLIVMRNEPPGAVARRAAHLRADLVRGGLGERCAIFVLSDTAGEDARMLELRLIAGLDGVSYRNRARNDGRKPGNIAEWIRREGADFETMAVLDADSRMGAARLAQMLARMDQEPRLGLLQSGIRLVPGRSRLARLQRISARLTGPGFARGFARWTGDAGNYWGHNALIRVAAFARHAALPRLSGRPPFGGDVLSHDFVEAAWLRRAGWLVEVDPESRGSFEEAPEALEELHRRDRRWAQGNLQHLRLIGAPGLHPASRLHFASGVQSYLSALLWLALVVLFASGLVQPGPLAPVAVVLVAGALLAPKLAGLAFWRARLGLGQGRARRRARRVLLRAALAELALTTALAPVMMLRQSAAVASVLAGRDCGWKRATPPRAPLLPRGVPEAVAGLALVALAAIAVLSPDGEGGMGGLVILLPVVVPLLAAPFLARWFDGEPPRRDAATALALGRA